MSDRFHRAARDGYLNALKEATKRDCNQSDEDGLTPTTIAAYEGNLDALRLLVGRGGDPEKCDYYGNTALHCAAARGHMHCVSFLVNFGVNIFALDNELHSAKDLAAINDKEEILRYLDLQAAKQEKEDSKKIKKQQEKSKKDAEKRQKEFDKLQKKADKRRQDEEDKMQKEREKINNQENVNQNAKKKSNIFDTISKNSLALVTGNKSEPKVIQSSNKNNSRKFSELTQNSEKNINNKVTLSAIQNKIIKKKAKDENQSSSNFKVRDSEVDGTKSVRNLSGLQLNSEILFVPSGSLSSTAIGKRGKLSEVFVSDEMEDMLQKDAHLQLKHGSIFDRPGFGSVAFRSSITNTLSSMKSSASEGSSESSLHPPEDFIDTSLESHESHHSSLLTPWEEEDLPSDDDEEDASPLFLFLLANGLQNFMPTFTGEQIDLESLMLLTDQDLEALKLPLGPRRKILRALNDRKLALEEPGEVTDVRL